MCTLDGNVFTTSAPVRSVIATKASTFSAIVVDLSFVVLIRSPAGIFFCYPLTLCDFCYNYITSLVRSISIKV